jgi:putative (di)nucleoside polyphosphate hydrolase
VDEGEEPLAAAWREMREEVGTDRARLLRASTIWRGYDLPPDIAARIWGGRYRGQSQLWVAFRFLGSDADIRLDLHDPEFVAWRWIEPERLIETAVPFKRDVYADVLKEFGPLCCPINR